MHADGDYTSKTLATCLHKTTFFLPATIIPTTLR